MFKLVVVAIALFAGISTAHASSIVKGGLGGQSYESASTQTVRHLVRPRSKMRSQRACYRNCMKQCDVSDNPFSGFCPEECRGACPLSK